jgi:hypothetical protein
MKGEPCEKVNERIITEGEITVQVMWFQELEDPIIQVHSPIPLLPRTGEIHETNCKFTRGDCWYHSLSYKEAGNVLSDR